MRKRGRIKRKIVRKVYIYIYIYIYIYNIYIYIYIIYREKEKRREDWSMHCTDRSLLFDIQNKK